MNQKITLVLVLVAIAAAIIILAPDEPLDAILVKENSTQDKTQRVLEKEQMYEYAPELRGLAGYINTNESISLQSLRDRVVLIDFWTYSCINCIRTLPYITAWDAKYKDDGLIIIGVHSPEFAFEKEYDNVLKAVEEHNIEYAVVQDNDFQTWRAYKNRFWPRKYLIDADGFIRYDKIGEGGYAETEKQIQLLLAEKNEIMDEEHQIETNIVEIFEDSRSIGTPEIYLGYGFARGNFGNPEGLKPDQVVDYTLPGELQPNNVYLEGSWLVQYDYSELVSDSGLVYLEYRAKDVNIVADANNSAEVFVMLDSSPVEDLGGADINESEASINEARMYRIIEDNISRQRKLLLNVSKGFRLFTFTFG